MYYYIPRELFAIKISKKIAISEIFCESIWLHKIKFNS